MLKVGDTVSWSGCWGSDNPQPAVVKHIEVETRGGKDGREVQEVPWTEVTRENCIVDLDNEHWAYGNQIKKL